MPSRALVRPRRRALFAVALLSLSAGVVLAAGSASAAPRPHSKVPMRVVISAPGPKAVVSGKVKFVAKVVGKRRAVRVEFRVDGRLRWVERTAPFVFGGDGRKLNTRRLKVGRHTLQVAAYDAAGRRVGATRTVTVRRGTGGVGGGAGGGGGGGTTPSKGGTTTPGTPKTTTKPKPSASAPPAVDGPASLFVSTGGSDSAACTSSAPCRSFDRAYHRAQPGQIVEVAGGTYPGQTITKDSSKTSAADVIFRPAAGARVVLNNSDTSRDDLDIYGDHVEVRGMVANQTWYVQPGANDVTLRDMDTKRFRITSASNVFVIGGDIGPDHNNASSIKAESATSARPRNIVVDGVLFHDYTRDPDEHVECLQAWSIDGFTLRNSTFTRCGVFNVFVAGLFQEVTDNALLENNFFDETIPGTGGQSVRIAATNSTFRYNSVLGYVFVDPDYSSNVAMTANVGKLSSGCTPGVAFAYNVWSGNKCGSTDVNAASGFTRATVGNMDLHLAAGSAAIGRGKPGDYPATDIDGQARPVGGAPDAGADER